MYVCIYTHASLSLAHTCQMREALSLSLCLCMSAHTHTHTHTYTHTCTHTCHTHAHTFVSLTLFRSLSLSLPPSRSLPSPSLPTSLVPPVRPLALLLPPLHPFEQFGRFPSLVPEPDEERTNWERLNALIGSGWWSCLTALLTVWVLGMFVGGGGRGKLRHGVWVEGFRHRV